MKEKKFFRCLAVVLTMTLFISVIPAAATEYDNTEDEEGTISLSESEIFTEEPEAQGQEITTDQTIDELEGAGDKSLDYLETNSDDQENVENQDALKYLADSDDEITITLSTESLDLNVGDTYTLTATVESYSEEEPELSYEIDTDGQKCVTVEQDGSEFVISADKNKAGSANITVFLADDPSCYAVCYVTVAVFDGFRQAADGNWYYYKNGVLQSQTTDVIKDTVGTVGAKGSWWNVVNGMVTPGVTVARNSNGWWYINANGMVDFSYNGFASNSNGKWYCEDGKVTFKKNGVLKDSTGTIGTKGDWYYVVESKVQTSYTGVANFSNSNGWWYIKKGKVDFTANTVAQNDNGWWYVKDGKVNFSYNGFASNGNGKWYCENGKVTFKKNSVIKDTTGAIGTKGDWYYVVGSKVQTSYTDVANYSNSNGWWYIKNGKVDFSANTVAKNNNGWWYVLGGKVQFGFTGLANYSNSHGWWYIKNGKVDFNASGVYKNKNGWWYVNKGKVNFSFNGLASNSNGMWVIKNGKVDFSYNGTYTYSGTTYKVTNGKVSQPSNTIGMGTSMFNKAQSQSSSTKWLIMVDVSNCKLGVLQGSKGYWTPVKYWTCSTGASATPTVRGTYSITSKGKSFGDGFTCWYYNQFYGNYLIHSILYNQGSQTSVQDGRLGMHVSHGCVRLSLTNAKWIYDNVPIGTRVVTY